MEIAKLKKSAHQLEKLPIHHGITDKQPLEKFECLSGKFKESLNFGSPPNKQLC
jgi:hypothetical protein